MFSFKLRGAYNKMARLSPEQLGRGVICASAGNHAQGVALSADRLGCRAVIVMPVTTPKLKIDAVRSYQGEVVLHGDSYSDAYLHALELSELHDYTFVHPFDDPDVIAGQGTVGMEILRQHQHPIHAIFVAIGGGGLISGVAAYVKAVRPEIKVIGVQMADSDAMVRSVKAGKRVTLHDVGLFSDGTAVKLVGEETFRLTRALVDDFVVVDTDAVCAAIKDVFEDTRSILEPAGALGVAAIKQYVARHDIKGEVAGRDHLRGQHEFRPAALRRRARRSGRGTRGVVRGDDPRGARQLPAPLRAHRPAQRDRIQLPHFRRTGSACFRRPRHRQPRGVRADRSGVRRTWLRRGRPDRRRALQAARPPHGRRPQPLGPRRAALSFRFSRAARRADAVSFRRMHPDWNISLFHYRNQGADYGRILIGIQIPSDEKDHFKNSSIVWLIPASMKPTIPRTVCFFDR